tara:strand:+ start:1153 stop:1278 length:126 start_codon:yes stop_codon:yes gene_type:complete
MKEKEIQRLADLLANKVKENQEKSNQEVLKQIKKAKEKKKD